MVGDDLRVVAANRQVCPTISEIFFWQPVHRVQSIGSSCAIILGRGGRFSSVSPLSSLSPRLFLAGRDGITPSAFFMPNKTGGRHAATPPGAGRPRMPLCGIWNFFGPWRLEFGIFHCAPPL